jgi:formate hydrogenlyase subunit 4
MTLNQGLRRESTANAAWRPGSPVLQIYAAVIEDLIIGNTCSG